MATRRRKRTARTCTAVGKSLKIGGKRFKVVKYHKTKTAANKHAARLKSQGKRVRKTKTSCGWRVASAG